MSKLSIDQKLRKFASKIINSNDENLITLQIDLTDYCVCKCLGCEHWKWNDKNKIDISILDNNIF